MVYKLVKGTSDIIFNIENWRYLEEKAKELCSIYGYKEIRTPIIETAELYRRSVGQYTDIVSKEMYAFFDKAERFIALRPEGTAGVVRAYIENKIYSGNRITKWYYIGPMFRYERPQAGRSRQFHQFGVEVFNCGDPMLDAEIIALGMKYFDSIGLYDVKVELNSLGDVESRKKYIAALVSYFEKYEKSLNEDDRRRLQINPLRVLDSKDRKVKELLATAPKITSYLNEKSQTYFSKVLAYLDSLDISYEVNPYLVRGLDYYQDTVFEFVASLGSNNKVCAIGGGGRYDKLVLQLGGPDVTGIGFGIGLERVLLSLTRSFLDKGITCYIIPLEEKVRLFCFKLLFLLRENNIRTDIAFENKKLKNNLKTALNLKAKFALIIGEEELMEDAVQVKDLKTKIQEKVARTKLVSFLRVGLINEK